MGKDVGDGSTVFAAAPLAAGAAAVAATAASDFGNDFGGNDRADAPAPAGLDLDLSQDAAPAGNTMEFGSDMETALPQAADAAVSPASVAAESDNLMDFDLGGLSFEPVGTTAPAIEMPAPAAETPLEDEFNLAFDTPAPAPAAAPAPAPAPVEDMSMDFGLDLPVAAAEPAEPGKPSAATDPLDLDLMSFEIPEVPAFSEPPKAEPAAMDFNDSLDLPADIESVTAAPPPAAPEFDLSSIDLDLDSGLGGGNAGTEAAAPPQRDDTLSAHHMEMDTKLDLAIAYQEIGDKEGARELLDEVLRGGSDDQIAKANAMKAQLG
jgi:pilus assembly protein FimV